MKLLQMTLPMLLLLLLGIVPGRRCLVASTAEVGQHSDEAENECHQDTNFDYDCGLGELRTRCISALWMCDNIHDCTTGKDEDNCNYLHKCPLGHFPCRNGDCLLANVRCDGHEDCMDGSDERVCATPKATLAVAPMKVADTEKNRRRPQTSHHFEDSMTGTHPAVNSVVQKGRHEPDDEIGRERRAEAVVDVNEDEESSSVLSFLLIASLFVALFTLIGLLLLRRNANSASRFDQALKDFNSQARNVGSSARNMLRARRMAGQARVIISTPVPTSSSGTANNDQFFDNPMNTMHQQPLVLQVPSSAIGSSPTTQPLIV